MEEPKNGVCRGKPIELQSNRDIEYRKTSPLISLVLVYFKKWLAHLLQYGKHFVVAGIMVS